MTDGGEKRDGDGDPPDEPLGDVAKKVRERTGQRPGSDDAPHREGPLSDVASEVDDRRQRKRDAPDAFEAVEVGELDGERLWEQLAEGEDAAVTVPSEASVTVERASSVSVEDGADGADEAEGGRNVRTIPKETCHGCPHFGDPPELHCTNDGTDILAMPDADHFRVADCPMVVDGEEDIGSIAVGGGDEEIGDDGAVGDAVDGGVDDAVDGATE